MLVNKRPKLELVHPEVLDTLHEASLRILEEVGYNFICEEALDILEATPGTKVVRDEHRVYMDRKLVMDSLAKCPARFTLHARNPAWTREIGGDTTIFLPTGGCPFTRDLERGRRAGRLADVIELMKIVHGLPEVDGSAIGTVAMQDVPVPIRPAVMEYVNYLYSDKTAGVGTLGPQAGEVERDLVGEFVETVELIFGSDWDYVAKPVGFDVVNSISPLMYDDRMSMTLINHAKTRQPVVIAPATMGGISGPMTLAGAFAQQNAEVLAGIVLVQAVGPGTPVVYGDVTTVSDMKVGAPSYGSAESAVSVVVGAQMARKYNIPSRGGGVLTDSKLPDVQAGIERMLVLFASVMAGQNIVLHGAGMLESFLCSSYELLLIDQDVIGMVKRFIEGMQVDEEALALDVIKEVGPQGMFLTTEHTYTHFKGAYFEPMLADRQIYAEWVKRGSKRAEERAYERWKHLLATYKQPPFDPTVEQMYRERIVRAERKALTDDLEDWPRHLVGLTGGMGTL